MMSSKKISILGFILLVIYIFPLFGPELRANSPTIVIYGFSILEEAINSGIVPAFQDFWRERTGETVRVYTSFGGSGTIMNQIRFGAPADIALFSHALDAYRLEDAGVVRPGWRRAPNRGILNRTPIVLVVRPGNPKKIERFEDLARPGIGIVHPDPQTSGGALWSTLAEYGAFIGMGGDASSGSRSAPEEASLRLRDLWKNVIILGASARASRTQFEMGFGDVLVTYEQEAVRDLARGRFKNELVIPPRTIYAEHPVVPIDRNIEPEEEERVAAFIAFLSSETAQRIFVEYGFRSIVSEELDEENPFLSEIPFPFTVEALGGWRKAYEEIIEEIWQKQILEAIGR